MSGPTTQEERDATASALHDYLEDHWGTAFYDDTDDSWVAPARVFVRLLDAGAKPYDPAYTHVEAAVRRALGANHQQEKTR